MAVLDRPDLEASPLADLHAIADQIGLEGFRRLRKAELIDAILAATPGGLKDRGESDGPPAGDDQEGSARPARVRRRRTRRGSGAQAEGRTEDLDEDEPEDSEPSPQEDAAEQQPSSRRGRSRGARSERSARSGAVDDGEGARIAEGVVEVLGNGSAFLRVDPPEASDEDVYISAAQVRRCELVSGDRVSGPVRTPRRSERYPSLVRIDTINGASADSVSDGSRYEDLPVAWPRERLALGAQDPTLEAIEWMTPLGHGSRVVIVGARQAGKSETLRRVLESVHGREDLDVSLVLVGARPEEIAQAQEGPVAPVAALSFAASADSQD